jgi:predicted AAA+ superfamily ATPase
LAQRLHPDFSGAGFAASLGLTAPTMRRYLDILADTFMLRVLAPYHANLGKRLIKSPKIYLRDSGLLHALLDIETLDALHAHPIAGAAWEGMVIEHLISHAAENVSPSFYRTVAGAELDLILETPARIQAFEAKFSVSPKLTKGYHLALSDLNIACGQVVYSGPDNYQMAQDTRVTSLTDAMLATARN